jgi:Domain of unknown function (DUF5664)
MKYEGTFNYFLDGESKTYNEIFNMVKTGMTVTIDGLNIRYFSPKKETVVDKILKEVENYQNKNGGILKGIEFPFDKDKYYDVYKHCKEPIEQKLDSPVFPYSPSIGKKENNGKPQISVIFKQFPDAIKAIAECSQYGHNKYKETDTDFLNFKRVYGGSKTYADAGLRHRIENGLDLESKLPHQYHVAWNALAELQLWIEENKYEL